MESISHREQYEKTGQDIHRVKSEITGDKSKDELATLVDERERLVAELEAEKSRAEDEARGDDTKLDEARNKIEDLTAAIDSYKNDIAEITGVTTEDLESLKSRFAPFLTETFTKWYDKEVAEKVEQKLAITAP